jgi:hypothetical protein
MATDELYEIRSKLVQFFQTITNISGAWYKAKAKTKMMIQEGNEKDAHNRTGSVSKTSEANGRKPLQSSSGRKRKLSSKLADSVGDESSPLHGKKTFSRSIGGTKSVQKKKIRLKKKNSSISDILDKAVSEEVPKESDKVTVTIVDPNPDRIVNPLLEVPQGSMTGEANLLVSEFVRLLPIFFPEPDTFPLSYYAKLLGFSLREDVSLEEQNGKWLLEDENGKSDPWFNIPPLGKCGSVFRDAAFNPTLDYVDKRGVRCDQYLDYVDPVWLELLNDVTSYQESSTRAATEMKESRIISKDCVSLAKSLGLVGGGVTFRVGGVEDAVALSNFNEQMNEAYWAQKLKMSHHVIIIANCDESNDIIGFIHFHFCWYPLKSLTALSAEDAALERIIRVDSVYVKDKRTDRGEKLIMILFGLALEDARRHAAWGIIDVQSTFSSLLERYYRMSVVGKGSSDDKTLLVCDFEKCNYRFAFYTEFERDKNYEPVGNFRFLVQLPLKIPVTSNINEVGSDQIMKVISDPVTQSSTDVHPITSKRSRELKDVPLKSITDDSKDSSLLENGDCVTMVPYDGNKPSDSTEDTEIHSNANENKSFDQQNKVTNGDYDHAKKPIPFKSITDSSSTVQEILHSHKTIAEPFDLNCPKTVQNPSIHKENIVHIHVEGGSVTETQHSEMIAAKFKTNRNDWNIVKLFPYHSTTSKPSIECDHVLLSLKKHQDDLKYTEATLIPRSQALMSQVYEERISFEFSAKEKIQSEKETIANYENLLQRKLEAQKAIEMQQQEDDNAVCDICYDGESSGENRIIFCDSCDVSVHQQCYEIDVVPKGDYFCRACLFFKRDTKESSSDITVEKNKFSPPIVCELCPKKGGAFVQTDTISDANDDKPVEAKWVHVLCAKWQGLLYLDRINGVIENVRSLKNDFREMDVYCHLCKGMRGAYNMCSKEGCKRWLHVTCARSSGICNVYHGEDHLGKIESEPKWQLACPEHSTFDADYTPLNKVELEDLVALAKTYPEEPKPFNKMNAKERKEKLSDPKVEWDLIQTLLTMKNGLRCETCDELLDDEYGTCSSCDSTVHNVCQLKKWERDCEGNLLCTSCASKHDKEDDPPNILQCHMCNKRHGTLVECFAKPLSMKKWKSIKSPAFRRSLFGRRTWCHPICGMAHPLTPFDQEIKKMLCSEIIMSDGVSHIESKQHCSLCGRSDKIKVACSYEPKKNLPTCKYRFHATCARQAGLQVDVQNDRFMCFMHMNHDFNLRAFMEDMIEPEKKRSGNDLRRSSLPMSLECAASIFNNGIRVLNCLGWAWQWAKWWVAHGDSWEPLLEEGQVESEMTNAELRKVESTPLSRRTDARKCRLVAFSAALRNRDYDKIEGNDRVPLNNALYAIMNTPSLVGPLSTKEKDFFVEWLGRVYRSKSHWLGFGDNKIPVAESWSENSLVHYPDQTEKFELGKRSLPGMLESNSQLHDIDDFFENESEISPTGAMQEKSTATKRKKANNTSKMVMTSEESSTGSVKISSAKKTRGKEPSSEGLVEVKSTIASSPRRGRPPKKKTVDMLKQHPQHNVKEQESGTKILKRKRGRPAKKKVNELEHENDGEKSTSYLPSVKKSSLEEGNINEIVDTPQFNAESNQSNAESNVQPDSTVIYDEVQAE